MRAYWQTPSDIAVYKGAKLGRYWRCFIGSFYTRKVKRKGLIESMFTMIKEDLICHLKALKQLISGIRKKNIKMGSWANEDRSVCCPAGHAGQSTYFYLRGFFLDSNRIIRYKKAQGEAACEMFFGKGSYARIFSPYKSSNKKDIIKRIEAEIKRIQTAV